MSYKKPDGLLLAKPVQRIAPKSNFLKKLEKKQQMTAEGIVAVLETNDGTVIKFRKGEKK